jgi:hypothetical protein
MPALVIVPTVAFPPATLLTLQATVVFVVLVTFAVNVAELPSSTELLVPVTVTTMAGGGGGGDTLATEPPPQPSAKDSATRRAHSAKFFAAICFSFLRERGRMPRPRQAKGQRRGH